VKREREEAGEEKRKGKILVLEERKMPGTAISISQLPRGSHHLRPQRKKETIASVSFFLYLH